MLIWYFKIKGDDLVIYSFFDWSEMYSTIVWNFKNIRDDLTINCTLAMYFAQPANNSAYTVTPVNTAETNKRWNTMATRVTLHLT